MSLRSPMPEEAVDGHQPLIWRPDANLIETNHPELPHDPAGPDPVPIEPRMRIRATERTACRAAAFGVVRMRTHLLTPDADLVFVRVDETREDALVRGGGLFATIVAEGEGLRWTLASPAVSPRNKCRTSLCSSRWYPIDRLRRIRITEMNAYLHGFRPHHRHPVRSTIELRAAVLERIGRSELSPAAPRNHGERARLDAIDRVLTLAGIDMAIRDEGRKRPFESWRRYLGV